MSDLSIYELEDIIWDEFCQSDDHIVPHSRDENACGHASQSESNKKPRIEVNTVDDKGAAKCHCPEKVERDCSTVNLPKLSMSEDGMWSYRPDGTLSVSCHGDPIKELATIASDNTKTSSNCFESNNIASLGELCSDDPILSSRSTAVHSNSYSYPLQISQAENGLSYIDIYEDGSSDLLCYSLDDIGFEDVFRNCDSSFGLQNKTSDDEKNWLSLSNDIEGSETASRTDFASTGPSANALENLPEDLEPSKLKTECSSANNTNMRSICATDITSPQLLEVEDTASPSCISIVKMSNETAESKDSIVFRDQQWKKREGRKNDQHVDNGESLHHTGDLGIEGKYFYSEDTSHNDHTTICVQQHKKNLGPDTFDYLHANGPYIQSDYEQPSDRTTVSPTLSGTNIEKNTATSFPQKGASHSFKVLQNKERCQDFSSMIIDVAPEEGRDNLCHYQGHQASFNSNTKNANVATICNPFSVQSGNEFKNYNDIKGVSSGIPAKLGPSYAQETPSISSGFNEGSLEATSFLQLQQVMKQLDLRTKLCIRDSLYRLARSAEQRHTNGDPGGDRDARTYIVDGTNKSSGFVDIETDTNPIDRSVAHLLFHRASLPLQSQSIIPDSAASPPMMVEKLANNESVA